MNLEEDIITYLDKQNFDDFTKIRWIYLYISSKFSFNIRVQFSSLKEKEKIYYKKVDIKNVEEFEIVCYTIANILIDALALIGVKGEIVKEKDEDLTHVYVRVTHKGKVIKLDPMIRHDHTRIKMNSKTLDFTSMIDDPKFEEELKEADDIIHYPNLDKEKYPNYYNDVAIKNLAEYVKKEAIENNWSKQELFFKKLNLIQTLVNDRKDFTRYDDIDYYMGYLMKKLEINDKEHASFKPIVFYKISEEGKWDIINLILIDYPSLPPVFYVMKKEEENYIMREIDYQEVERYLEEYESIYSYYIQTIIKKNRRK